MHRRSQARLHSSLRDSPLAAPLAEASGGGLRRTRRLQWADVQSRAVSFNRRGRVRRALVSQTLTSMPAYCG